jgi:hypothetical protein
MKKFKKAEKGNQIFETQNKIKKWNSVDYIKI